ncbi:MAG: metabolite traffic protein EboE [Planctomycetota bacterium]
MSASFEFGYCTNVHAGMTLAAAKANLMQHSAPIRQQICPNSKLPLGLWLSETVAAELKDPSTARSFHQWLQENHFAAYTLNGFPQKDFHQDVVKHDVYKPTWLDPQRVEYTKLLAEILVELIDGPTGTISTVPLGWPAPAWTKEHFEAAAANMQSVATHLAQLHERTGKEIILAIEPEPGCILNTAPEIVDFFSKFLFNGSAEADARRYLTVCHDVCHSGVMFEGQAFALGQYREHGIRVGKVQISSAVHVPWDHAKDQPEMQEAMLEQLQGFNEPKYLHQTTRLENHGERAELCEDLPEALATWLSEMPSSPWRVHFHVPIFVSQFGYLETTQSDIAEAVHFLENHRDNHVDDVDWFTGHYEVETYAWPVLPADLAADDLPSGIARELEYFADLLDKCRS